MGKIVMPKNSALLNEIESVLKIYYEAGNWLPNDEYKEKLKALIGDDQYSSSYTKKAQITSYFGFTESLDLHTKRITAAGKEMYEAILAHDSNKIQDVLMASLETTTFGRNNDGCPDSNSDVEPPLLFIRAVLDLGYLTYKEFAYLLWKLEDMGQNYTDSLSDIKNFRSQGQIDIGDEAQKYTDAKPIMILIRWNFLMEADDSQGGKHITLRPEVKSKYENRLRNLKVYNIDANVSSLLRNANIKFTPEWFHEKGQKYLFLDAEAKPLYDAFRNKYAPSKLEALSGLDLINSIFINHTNQKDNLCYELEFNSDNRRLFGSIKSGTAFKYGLFYSPKYSSWVTGSGKNPEMLSEDDAIILGTQIRDYLVAGAKEIDKWNPDDGYTVLFDKLYDVTEGYINKVWVMKYYHMIYPDIFSTTYSPDAQIKVLTTVGDIPSDTPMIRSGQISDFIKKCDISPVVFNKVFWSSIGDEEEEPAMKSLVYNTSFKSPYSLNRIVFGAPGTGKSYQIKKDCNQLIGIGNETDYERVTFHPDYSYANFVGTYKPVPCQDSEGNDAITYKYVPGPFMRMYVEALKNGRTDNVKPFVLIIEEINRANVAAVFGDIFQLLDRDESGVSEYPIQTSEDIKKYLSEKLGGNPDEYNKIRIPNNMFIWATMNSADQGVFPMDTAFKRRWDFTYIGINDNDHDIQGKYVVLGSEKVQRVEWNALRKSINDYLASQNINEDKQIGPYFISRDIVVPMSGDDIDREKFCETFKSKVIMYLFEDAAKQKRASLFEGCFKNKSRYSGICEEFDAKGIGIFNHEIQINANPEDLPDNSVQP